VDGCFIADETLEEPAAVGLGGQRSRRGIDLNQPRMRAEALTALAARPGGFTASQLAAEIQSRGQAEYGARRATYDLKKLREPSNWCAGSHAPGATNPLQTRCVP